MTKQEKRPGESIDSVLRKFKRKIKNDGILQELRKREFFEKPSDIRLTLKFKNSIITHFLNHFK